MAQGSIVPVPMASATLSPNTREGDEVEERGPEHCIATRAETMLAIELRRRARSLKKSNHSATAIRPINTGRPQR
jgi:hypothetical protein